MILFFSLLFPLHWLSVSNVKPFSPSFFPSTSCIKIFFLYFFIDYLYQCSSRCLPWRLEPTPELAHLYSDQCQGFASTISTRLYYGCMYSLFVCVLCDYVKGGRAELIQKSIRYFNLYLYSDQCQGFARTISTRLYYGCLYSLFFCVCDHVQGGYYFRNQQYIIIYIGVLWPIWAILMRIHALFGVPLKA